jgi:hypothetical protein
MRRLIEYAECTGRRGIFRGTHGQKATRRHSMERRGFLQALALTALGSTLARTVQAAQAGTMQDIEALQKNWRALLAANFKAPAPGEALKLPNDEWRKRLDAVQY